MRVNFIPADQAVGNNFGNESGDEDQQYAATPQSMAIRDENNTLIAVSHDKKFLQMLERANVVESYIDDCCRTESKIGTLSNEEVGGGVYVDSRLLHSVLGINSESGELANQLKRHIFYGKELDTVNLKEELGDLLWYVSIAMKVLGITYAEVMDLNIKKLKARYPDKFSQDKALNRDLDKERKVLEGNA